MTFINLGAKTQKINLFNVQKIKLTKEKRELQKTKYLSLNKREI